MIFITIESVVLQELSKFRISCMRSPTFPVWSSCGSADRGRREGRREGGKEE